MIRELGISGGAMAVVVLAQAAPPPMPELGNVTATAILGWYAWHTAARTIPGLVAEFRAELAARRGESQAERELYRQELREERGQRHADHLAVVQAIREVRSAERRGSAECGVRSAE